jgi:hypothetical protein
MATAQEKLQAAERVVADSLLHGWTIQAKIDYIRTWLPHHYEVKESTHKGSVHCKSRDGITDEEIWDYFIAAIKQRFGDLFLEIDHNTCYNHVDFTVYFRTTPK